MQAALGDTKHEPGEPHDERDGAERVEAAHLVGLGQLAQDQRTPGRAGQRQRHVEPEDPVPGDLHERAAENRTEHEADGGDHRVGAHSQSELLLGKGVGDKSGSVGEQERRANPLQHPPADQLVAPPEKPAPSEAKANSKKPPI